MIQTTYNLLRRAHACTDGYSKFRKHIGDVGDDTPIPLHRACDSNSVQDILWALGNATLGPRPDRLLRELACDFAEHVLPIFEAQYPDDKRPRRAIKVARRYACGEASQNAFERARRAAAYAAADVATYATHAADATYANAAAATHAADAAYAVALVVDAHHLAGVARAAAVDDAAERTWQLSHLREALLKS